MKLTKDEDVEFFHDAYSDSTGYHQMGWCISLNLQLKTKEEAQEVWNQILENQSDAEKYREDFNGLTAKNIGEWQNIQIKYIELVERLKKRIEELENYKDGKGVLTKNKPDSKFTLTDISDEILQELQKILGEKK